MSSTSSEWRVDRSLDFRMLSRLFRRARRRQLCPRTGCGRRKRVLVHGAAFWRLFFLLSQHRSRIFTSLSLATPVSTIPARMPRLRLPPKPSSKDALAMLVSALKVTKAVSDAIRGIAGTERPRRIYCITARPRMLRREQSMKSGGHIGPAGCVLAGRR